MAAPQGVVRVRRHKQTVIYRVEGRATMTQSHGFRRSAEDALAAGARQLEVDLRQCTFFDSTFLGTLLLLHRSCLRRPGVTFSLVAPSSPCSRLLEQMGVSEVFPVVEPEEEPAASEWQDLGAGQATPCVMKDNVVQAHVALANLPGPAGEAFRAVAHCLTEAQKAEQHKS